MAADDEGPDDRRLLLNLGYRMLGSLSDAEDAVQEAYLRWYRLSERQRAEIGSATGWLVTVVSRICLDMLGSARSRRERYVGEWLPEPVPDVELWTSLGRPVGGADPADRVTLDESVSMALLVVLEALTPAERVAFVLHDVFRYPFAEVADVLGRSPQACRKLASSARQRIRAGRPDSAPHDRHDALVTAFRAAWETGDLAGLLEVLAPDATAITDGGGLVSAALEPVRGAEAVARFLLAVPERQPDLELRDARVNGRAGLVARAAGETLAVVSVETSGELVQHVWVVRNPEKLRAWHRTDGTSAAGSPA